MENRQSMAGKKSWLVMLYIAGDDYDPAYPDDVSLNPRFDEMIKRLQNATIDPSVQLVVLYDENMLKRSPQKHANSIWIRENDNSWTEVSESLGQQGAIFFYRGKDGRRELNTGNYATLEAFIRWALGKYDKVEHTLLSVIGHGGGWSPTTPFLEKFDPFYPEADLSLLNPDSKSGGDFTPSLNGLCPDYSSMTAISTVQLGLALKQGLGGRKLDILFLDACLMSMIEVACEIQRHVDYLIAGENLLYALLPYETYLAPVVPASPEEFAKSIVDLYNRSGVQKPWSIAQIKINTHSLLVSSVDQLAKELIDAIHLDRKVVNHFYHAYDACQKFDYDANLEIDKNKDAYVDLYDFARHLIEQIKLDERFKHIVKIALDIMCLLRYDQIVVPESSVGPIHCEESSIIIRRKRQSDVKIPAMLLDNANGVSVYLPLGEEEDRRRDTKTHKLLNKPYLDYYRDVDHLAFAEQAKNWARLLKILVDNLPSDRSLVRDTTKSPYRTPRQLP